MNGRTRASRVATAGPRYVDLQADTEVFAPATRDFQAKVIARRFGSAPALSGVLAELAYPDVDDWRCRA